MLSSEINGLLGWFVTLGAGWVVAMVSTLQALQGRVLCCGFAAQQKE